MIPVDGGAISSIRAPRRGEAASRRLGTVRPSRIATGRRAAPGMAAEPDRCLLCLLLIICPPAGIAWWLLSRRRPGAEPGGQLPAAAVPR